MTFITSIISYCYQAANYFWSLYYYCSTAPWPLSTLTNFFLFLSDIFKSLSFAFNDFKTWLTDANTKIGQILSISAITNYFQTWINYATNAYNWVLNAWNNVSFVVTYWWNTAQQTVLVWIENAKQWALAQVNNLAATLAPVVAGWNSFVASIPSLNTIISWFTNWWANILFNLSSWWTQRLLDIKALFNSWTLDLSPFWAGWQEIRDKVFEFFNDPLEWLLAEFTDWFLGKE